MSGPAIPGYENFSLIGKGGFSRVYRAEQSKLKRHVAVKVLNFGLNDEADRVSFERETELMGRVSAHPDIVTVHDTEFTTHGQPCIVMELYPGGSLADLIGEMGRLSAKEALEVGVAIASALDVSHHSGVLHCDLKPQNILISEFGQPALGDFGISTFAEERTRTGTDSGAGFTLPYAAPEIVEGESPAVATDIYSLAATLYTALAGHRPFSQPGSNESKPSPAEQARRILLEEVPSLVPYGVPAEVDALLQNAMSKEATDRPATAAAFAQAMHQVGQQLGFGTSAPRTATGGGALPVIENPESTLVDDSMAVPAPPELTGPFRRVEPAGAAAETDSRPLAQPKQRSSDAFVATPGGFDARGDHTVHRAEVNLEPEPVEAPPEETGVPLRRRLLAIAFAVVGIVAAAAVILFVTRGDDGEVAEPVDDNPVVVANPVDPVRAPDPPTDVALERLGVTGLRVTWATTEDDLDSVTYEVRRQDVDDFQAVRTPETQLVLSGVPATERPCVTVMALRGNRTSSVTAPVCLEAQTGGGFIEIRPTTCAQGDCDVRVVLNDFAANSRVEIVVLDPDDLDINGFGDVYESSATTDARGQIDSWRLSLPPLAGPGDYLIVVGDDVGETFSALLTVTE